MIYYQHIGERLSQRDFPRSLGTPKDGLKMFSYDYIIDFISHISKIELSDIRRRIQEFAPEGFQIWGLPSGAKNVTKSMKTGDYLMLLEHCDFQYCGKVIHRISDQCFDLSYDIWGEKRFPIVVLLAGSMISYDWEEFLVDFDFNPRYHMRGQTMRLAKNRVSRSGFQNEKDFISKLLTEKNTTHR